MKARLFKINTKFVGRENELNYIKKLQQADTAQILVVYGRRRAGKTELIEQSFRTRQLLKFEGLENQSPAEQRVHFLEQLAEYVQDSKISKLKYESWKEVFELLAQYCKQGVWTIYLEELQWMANYEDELISELKYVWDNFLSKNSKIILVLCGSAPSFIINKVINSKALYNRSLNQIHLGEFSIEESYEFLEKKSIGLHELMDIYLTIGGIPEYLKYFKRGAPFFKTLGNESFLRGGFFVSEYKRIFTSSLAKNPDYQKIISYLAKNKYASRENIIKFLNIKSGGYLTGLLVDLEESGFIEKITPLGTGAKTTLCYYVIKDAYLQFYFKFIEPELGKINENHFEENALAALEMATYRKWLGFAFEKWCRRNSRRIAKHLEFSAIKYEVGSYFKRDHLKQNKGLQIDLLFNRKDRVKTVCEVKYTESPVGTSVINAFEKKIQLLDITKTESISRVLISARGADKSLKDRAYFDAIITLEDLVRTGKN